MQLDNGGLHAQANTPNNCFIECLDSGSTLKYNSSSMSIDNNSTAFQGVAECDQLVRNNTSIANDPLRFNNASGSRVLRINNDGKGICIGADVYDSLVQKASSSLAGAMSGASISSSGTINATGANFRRIY